MISKQQFRVRNFQFWKDLHEFFCINKYIINIERNLQFLRSKKYIFNIFYTVEKFQIFGIESI